MNTNIVQLLQKGFRVSLGATASLIEILQDPQRRGENIAKLRAELSELSEEWAAKGAMTEQEARNFVETVLSQQQSTNGQSPVRDRRPTSSTQTTTASSATDPNVQSDLQDLTAQIAAIRAELEKLREQDSLP